MSTPTESTRSLFLSDVETRHQPGIYATLVADARFRGVEYSKMIMGLGVAQMSEAAHRAQGQALAERGYTRS